MSAAIDTRVSEVSDLAHQSLLERLEVIPGVLVTSRISPPLCLPLVEVRLSCDDPEAEAAVYRAELEVRQRYPAARLDVRVV